MHFITVDYYYKGDSDFLVNVSLKTFPRFEKKKKKQKQQWVLIATKPFACSCRGDSSRSATPAALPIHQQAQCQAYPAEDF